MHLLRKPLVLLGVLASVAIAVLMYATHEDIRISLASIAGLTALVLTLQLELILTAGVADVWRRAQALPWLDKALLQVIDDAYRLNQDRSPEGDLYNAAARSGLQRYASNLSELRAGRYRLSFLDTECLVEAAGRVTKHLRAVSLSSSGSDFWGSESGQRYYGANLKARRSGASVERVFVYNDVTEARVLAVAKKQAKEIDVWTVHEARLSPDLLVDLVVFDDRLGYRANASQGREVDSQVLERRDPEIEALNRTFRAVRGIANKVR